MDVEQFDRLAELADEAEDEEQIEYWQHGEPGDSIKGLLLGYERGLTAKNGNTYDLAVLHNPKIDQRVGIPLWRKALSGKFRDLKPRIGELVAITYQGMGETRSGTSFHDYRVVVIDKDGNRVFRRTDDDDELGELPAAPMSEWTAAHGTDAPKAERRARVRRDLGLDDEAVADVPF